MAARSSGSRRPKTSGAVQNLPQLRVWALQTIIFPSIAHGFSPPGIDSALLHLRAKAFHSIYLVQPTAYSYVGLGIYYLVPSDARRAGSKLVVLVSQFLVPMISIVSS